MLFTCYYCCILCATCVNTYVSWALRNSDLMLNIATDTKLPMY